MQRSLVGSEMCIRDRPMHKPGTMQLDDFTEEALTDRAPPSLVFEDDTPEPMDTFDVDEEDRIAALEWDAYEAAQDPSEHEPEEPPMPLPEAPAPSKEGRHGAAMGIGPIIQTSHFGRLDERRRARSRRRPEGTHSHSTVV